MSGGFNGQTWMLPFWVVPAIYLEDLYSFVADLAPLARTLVNKTVLAHQHPIMPNFADGLATDASDSPDKLS
jgi:hypothetical protein